MSTTTVAPQRHALDELPWVELDGEFGVVLEEFEAAVDRRIRTRSAATRHAPRTQVVMLPEVAALGGGLRDEAVAAENDLQEVLDFKDGATVMSTSEQETFDALARERSPRLAKPLTID